MITDTVVKSKYSKPYGVILLIVISFVVSRVVSWAEGTSHFALGLEVSLDRQKWRDLIIALGITSTTSTVVSRY